MFRYLSEAVVTISYAQPLGVLMNSFWQLNLTNIFIRSPRIAYKWDAYVKINSPSAITFLNSTTVRNITTTMGADNLTATVLATNIRERIFLLVYKNVHIH